MNFVKQRVRRQRRIHQQSKFVPQNTKLAITQNRDCRDKSVFMEVVDLFPRKPVRFAALSVAKRDQDRFVKIRKIGTRHSTDNNLTARAAQKAGQRLENGMGVAVVLSEQEQPPLHVLANSLPIE